MKVTITARKMQVPQSFPDYADKKLDSKLSKFFGEEADAKITMTEHKNQIILELTVKYNNMIFRAERTAEDKNDALDSAIDNIKHKTFVMRPMDVEEAILEMNMLGHSFFMFCNAQTGGTNVVYKRADGNYAVLEPTTE